MSLHNAKKTVLIRLGVPVLIILFFLGGGYFLQKTIQNPVLKKVDEADLGGPFSMTDHLGTAVTDKDYADKPKLIYFGFTHCPAICPTELQKMSTALHFLGEDANKIHALFVTVDPQRDTVSAMKDYVSLFHDNLIGLSGTQEQTDTIKKAWNIYSAKVESPELTEYTVDHSTYTYFMDKDNRFVARFKMKDTAQEMAATIKEHLNKALQDQ